MVCGGGGRNDGALTFIEAGGEISEVENLVELSKEGTVMTKDLLANDWDVDVDVGAQISVDEGGVDELFVKEE